MRPKNLSTRYFSKKQEKHIAKTLGGKQTANSGATAFSKGDVLLDDFLIEAKTHTCERDTFTVRKEWIKKNEEEAFAMNKPYSALALDFGDGEQHYLISENLFKLLVEYLKGR